jgi:hypothetical protein
MESTIPLLPCKSLEETLTFYRALSFEVTHEQTTPYLYGAVRRGEVDLHFARSATMSRRRSMGGLRKICRGWRRRLRTLSFYLTPMPMMPQPPKPWMWRLDGTSR